MYRMAKNGKKAGRPAIRPPTTPAELNQLFQYCLLGATNEELAAFYGVTRTTIDKWIANKDGTTTEFAGTLTRGRDGADKRVAKALFRRAIGYEHRATKIFYDAKKRGWHLKPGVEKEDAVYPDDYEYDDGTVAVDYIERYPPSEVAAFFWLKNRQKDRWREKQELDVNNSGAVELNIEWKPAEGCKPLRPIEEIEAEAAKEDDQLKQSTDVTND